VIEPVARRPRSPRAFAALLIAGALACAGFVALGVWQVHRLAWKEALIARVDAHLHAAPVAPPGPAAWPALMRDPDEYLRVELHGRFANALETPVRASTELGAGYWVLTPLLTDQGFWVLVNRGFVPPELRERSRRLAQEPEGEQTVVGLLRFSEPHGSLLQHNEPAQGRWYSRDVAAMAAARGLGTGAHPGPVAPYFVDAGMPAEAAAASDAWPRAGLTVIRFRNDHLVYAFTWFALAAMVAGAMGYLWVDEQRLRRLADPHAPAPHRSRRA
jgi:surfeit locus 1 family protein